MSTGLIENARLPMIGEHAPDFVPVTTHGERRLDDFKGAWLVLFSHPADFTPVCATELIVFAKINADLKKRRTELLGLSVDSVTSHITWVKSIEDEMGVGIPFPVIADLDRTISTRYGMIHPGQSKTETVRCIFVIDPEGVIRAMVYYPMTIGRNTAEIVRLIDALQTSDKHKVATPANWKPGDKVIVPAPQTMEAAQQRANEGYDCKDWYLCFNKV